MVSLIMTEKASSKVKELILGEGVNTNEVLLRISLTPGEEQGYYKYGMSLEADADVENDLELEQNGLRLVVDKESARLLDGAEIDYIEQEEGGAFTIKNTKL